MQPPTERSATVTLPDILEARRADQAAALLHSYYTQKLTSGHVRTGSYFDTWAGGGAGPSVANRLTAEDLVAIALLGEDIKGPAVLGLLETHAEEITGLLEQIPADLNMAEVPPEDFTRLYGKDSAAWQLWDLIRGYKGGQWRMGPTKTSKLMARKRPKLIPVWDSVVASAAGLSSSLTYWEEWHGLLRANDGELARRLDKVQEAAELPAPVTTLRAMDVILWMDGKQRGFRHTGTDDE